MFVTDFSYILLFVPAVVCMSYGFRCEDKKSSAARLKLITGFLIFSSFLYYISNDVENFSILIISIILNFIGYQSLQRTKKAIHAKLILSLFISANLAILLYFKYYNFFVDNINHATGIRLVGLDVVLPLGISFFTFQQISVLVDTFRSEIKPAGGGILGEFFQYILFVSLFPQLVAGPIVRFNEVMPQLRGLSKPLSKRLISIGLLIFIIGLTKKICLADVFAIWADEGFSRGDDLTLISAWLTVLSFSFQIYFDFSGYSDIAIGIGTMLGIHLPDNFDGPYRAQNLRDFWRTWHMTLSRFFRDYLYIPLGGSRFSSTRTALNLIAVFLLVGLWHGASWSFVLWGAFHGAGLFVHRLWGRIGLTLPAALGWLLTFVFVSVGWAFFRATDIWAAQTIVASMFGFNGVVLPWPHVNDVTAGDWFLPYRLGFDIFGSVGLSDWTFIYVMLGFFVVLSFPTSATMRRQLIEQSWKVDLAGAIAVAGFAVVVFFKLFIVTNVNFLYWQF